MKRRFSTLLFALAVLVAPLAVARSADSGLPPLPPLNDPATDVRIPGKFIWADLVTSDVAAARRFYSSLFGWEWRWVSQHPDHPYGMFYKNDIAVAGVAHRASPEPDMPYGRWVHYISAADVSDTTQRVVNGGGRALLSRRSIPYRGDFAVVADPEGAPFGVMHSSSGDPPDFRAGFGEWLWVGLASRDAGAASRFYQTLFGYDIHDLRESSTVLEFILAGGGHARAGIGQLSEESEAKPTWVGFVRVEDLEGSVEKAQAAGGELLYAPDNDGSNGDLAILADPFGAPVGLMRWSYEDEPAETAAPEPQP